MHIFLFVLAQNPVFNTLTEGILNFVSVCQTLNKTFANLENKYLYSWLAKTG